MPNVAGCFSETTAGRVEGGSQSVGLASRNLALRQAERSASTLLISTLPPPSSRAMTLPLRAFASLTLTPGPGPAGSSEASISSPVPSGPLIFARTRRKMSNPTITTKANMPTTARVIVELSTERPPRALPQGSHFAIGIATPVRAFREA